MLFEISFNTKDMAFRNNFKNWEHQLNNDICEKLHGKKWTYKSKQGLERCFKRITKQGDVQKETMILNTEKYGKQIVAIAIPGWTLGYCDFDKVYTKLMKDKYVKVPFESFYDSRLYFAYKNAFIEIRCIS